MHLCGMYTNIWHEEQLLFSLLTVHLNQMTNTEALSIYIKKQLTKEIHIFPDTVMLCGQSEEQLFSTVLASALPNEAAFRLLLCSIQSVNGKIKYTIMSVCYFI